MFSAKKPLAFPLAALALACAGFAATTATPAQAGTVIASSGPSASQYPKGRQIADTARVTLRAGDSLTVLTGSGTRVLRGPGTFVVGARGTSNRSVFRQLTSRRAGSRVRTGAVRGAAPAATPASAAGITNPNLWNLDVSKGGNFCVTDLSRVRMWRPGSEGESTYVVQRAGSTEHLHVTFNEGRTMSALNTAEMPVADGSQFVIQKEDGGTPVNVTFAMLGEPGDDPEALAAQLIEKGCDNQLEMLANRMMTS